MTEFLVVMIFMVPILFAIIYIGKYADIKHSVIQASRYAAFQRVMQPESTRLPTHDIQDKLRARFFVHGGGRHHGNPDGEIRSVDSAIAVTPGSDVVMWRDLRGNPLLPHLDRVTLNYGEQQFSTVVQTTDAWMHATYGLPVQRIHVAQVEVSVDDQLQENHPVLTVRAGTALSADTAHAQGSEGVRAAVRGHPVFGAVTTAIGWVEPAINSFVGLFERVRPEWSCLKVESVPSDRLSGPGSAGACR